MEFSYLLVGKTSQGRGSNEWEEAQIQLIAVSNDCYYCNVLKNLTVTLSDTLRRNVESGCVPDKPKLVWYARKLDLNSLDRLASLRAVRYKIVGIQVT